MSVPELLSKLLTATGPSGHESAAAAVWREGCASFAAEVGSDNVGSSYARVAGTAGGPTLAIVGHIDEIGLHVSHIDDDGYLRFGQVGGWDTVVLVGQRVRLETRQGRVTGVIARKPVHLHQGRRAQQGARAQGPAHRHRRQGRRRGPRAGADRRRGGDRRRPGRAAPRPRDLARARQPGRLLRGRPGGEADRAGRRRSRRRDSRSRSPRRRRRSPGRARARSPTSPTSRSSST